ncbi:hypothetical protein A2U01_0115312, partial [Trifolium medium]|nr:hypothetical protein [Trifolium medium]
MASGTNPFLNPGCNLNQGPSGVLDMCGGVVSVESISNGERESQHRDE